MTWSKWDLHGDTKDGLVCRGCGFRGGLKPGEHRALLGRRGPRGDTVCSQVQRGAGPLPEKTRLGSKVSWGRAGHPKGPWGFSCRDWTTCWGGQPMRRGLGDGAKWIQDKCEGLARRPEAGA